MTINSSTEQAIMIPDILKKVLRACSVAVSERLCESLR
eukprot:CAMPEP_0168569616 /NCGR_PEP_ID=MMETSP0413-20121227/16264_1 /TAXON_ID=136452 /ORGANISM="Filamoeba nolandi, Strain NC-AS-23-1" /LENGTH=37 /DNA_ID= /DNA_START= /DNA_END= /DNA_ORIENTATION=